MPGLSEKIRIDERDKLIAYIDFILYNSQHTNTTCQECEDVDLRLLRARLAKMNAEAERR
jgi:hypothetical protein